MGYRELAGITRDVKLHEHRHTCATWQANGARGVEFSLFDVAKNLGHSDTKTTERYAHDTAKGRTEKTAAMNRTPETQALTRLVEAGLPGAGRAPHRRLRGAVTNVMRVQIGPRVRCPLATWRNRWRPRAELNCRPTV